MASSHSDLTVNDDSCYAYPWKQKFVYPCFTCKPLKNNALTVKHQSGVNGQIKKCVVDEG